MTTVAPAAAARRAPASSMQSSWNQRAAAPRGQRVVDDCGQVLASPEDVHEIDRTRDVLDAAIDLLPEDLLLAGIDGDDLVAALEEVAGDAVRIPVRFRGKAHDGDAAHALEQALDRLVVRVPEGSWHPWGLGFLLADANTANDS